MKLKVYLVLAVLLLVACEYRPERPSIPDEALSPNIRGRDIEIVDRGVSSETEPSPSILPRRPLDLVVNDCDGFTWFNGSDTIIDRERGILVEGWTDPGAGNENRTLTIDVFSPSCRQHERVIHFFFYGDGPIANVRGKDVTRIKDHDGFPEVLPRHPLHLVIEDCDGFQDFTTNDDQIDTWTGTSTRFWSDPGVKGEGRSLTLLMFSPSCRRMFPDERFAFGPRR